MTTPTPDQLELIRSAVDDAPSEQTARELSALLRESPEARAAYLDYVGLHALLDWDRAERVHTNDDADAPVELDANASLTRLSIFSPRYLAAAALLLAAAAVAIYFAAFAGSPTSQLPDHTGPPVAVLMGADGVRWDGEPVATGDTLSAGPIAITSGRLEFETFTGANVALSGPARYVVTGANRGRLETGALVARIDPEAHGFTVDTPHGVRVVDLGTEFAIGLSDAGGTEVAVLDGSVQVERTDNTPIKLVPGDIVRLAPGQPLATIAAPDRTLRSIVESTHPVRTSFDYTRLHPALEIPAPDRFAIDNGVLRYVGPTETRAYVRTRRADLLDRSFRLEATFTTEPRDEDDVIARFGVGNRLFIGIGDGVPAAPEKWNEPANSFGFSLVLSNGDVIFQSTSNGVITGHGHTLTEEPLYGRLRLRLDKRGGELWLAIDRDPGEHFEADVTLGPIAIPDTLALDPRHAHAYLGTGHFGLSTEIDDLEFTLDPNLAPEPGVEN